MSAAKQQAMLAALWAPRPAEALALLGDAALASTTRGAACAPTAATGALARRALAIPVVAALLGEENFNALATSCGCATRPSAATWRAGASSCRR